MIWVSHWDGSFKYPQHVLVEKQENYFLIEACSYSFFACGNLCRWLITLQIDWNFGSKSFDTHVKPIVKKQ